MGDFMSDCETTRAKGGIGIFFDGWVLCLLDHIYLVKMQHTTHSTHELHPQQLSAQTDYASP